MKNYFTKRQLIRQGASSKDATELARLAKNLRGSMPGLNPDAKKQIAQDIGFKPVKSTSSFRFATAGVFVALVVLVVTAQSAQPGSVLYALKRGTEEVRVILQPGFNEDDIQQRREDERQHAIEDDKQEDAGVEESDDEKEAESVSEDSLKEFESSEQDVEDVANEPEKQQEDETQTNQEDTETVEPDKNDSPEED